MYERKYIFFKYNCEFELKCERETISSVKKKEKNTLLFLSPHTINLGNNTFVRLTLYCPHIVAMILYGYLPYFNFFLSHSYQFLFLFPIWHIIFSQTYFPILPIYFRSSGSIKLRNVQLEKKNFKLHLTECFSENISWLIMIAKILNIYKTDVNNIINIVKINFDVFDVLMKYAWQLHLIKEIKPDCWTPKNENNSHNYFASQTINAIQ